ncbi:MAG: hypothetical protein M3P52_04415 [Actinomycetota bacterium]|nr:hypothetical protein [Actinomycetota bacterium]
MPRTSRLTLLFVFVTAACSPFASGDAEPEVCPPQERDVLVAEKLTPETPSTPFAVTADDDVWVGLIADSDFSESALLSQVTGLYVIEEGDSVEYTRNDVDFVVTDDPYLDYDRQGEFNRFELPPGRYQVWSIKAPEIAVVSCRSGR